MDRSHHKTGRFLPSTHIPVYSPDHLRVTKPDYVLILLWNLTDEIVSQQEEIRTWDQRFVVPIPQVRILT